MISDRHGAGRYHPCLRCTNRFEDIFVGNLKEQFPHYFHYYFAQSNARIARIAGRARALHLRCVRSHRTAAIRFLCFSSLLISFCAICSHRFLQVRTPRSVQHAPPERALYATHCALNIFAARHAPWGTAQRMQRSRSSPPPGRIFESSVFFASIWRHAAACVHTMPSYLFPSY